MSDIENKDREFNKKEIERGWKEIKFLIKFFLWISLISIAFVLFMSIF